MFRKIENIKNRKSLLLAFGGFKSIVSARKVYLFNDNLIYETLRELYNEEQDNLELQQAKEDYERIKGLYGNNELLKTEYTHCEKVYTSLKLIMEYKHELKKLKMN